MRKRVHRALEQLVETGEHVVLAVSGGGDSVALAHLLSELAPELGITLSIACVDHGLRAESADEARSVEALAAELGLPFDGVRLEDLGSGNLQARARHARYEALHAIRERRGATKIATGHTLDDQAETVLARALNGVGVAGLSGIRPQRADGVIRPLLSCRREELRAYLRSRGGRWVEDPSNESPAFERVRARRLLAGIEEDWPGATEHLAQLAQDARDAHRALRSRSRAWLARSRGRHGLQLSALRAASSGVRAAVLRRWVRDETQRGVSRSHSRALEELVRTGRGEVLLGEGWGVSRRGDELVLDRRKRRTRST